MKKCKTFCKIYRFDIKKVYNQGMFEYILENEEKKTIKNEDDIVSQVTNMWDTFHERRKSHLDIIDLLKTKIYLTDTQQRAYLKRMQSSNRNEFDENNWQSMVDTNVIYSLAETLKAFTKEMTYKDLEQLFDVDGESEDQQTNANVQKEYLIHNLEDMGVEQEITRAIEYSTTSGEINFFTGWSVRYKDIKRRSDLIPTIQAQIDRNFRPDIITDEFGNQIEQSKMQVISDDGQIAKLRIPIYEGATVQAIDSVNLIFDPDNYKDWDGCSKILKTFAPISDVLNNKLYKLSADAKKDLRKKLTSSTENKNKDSSDKVDDRYIGNQVELLQFWGDFVANNTVLKNWSIVVVAGKYLVLFEQNRFVINPLINQANLRDPKTGRGIPVLYSILGIVEAQNKLLNDLSDISSLKKNKPVFAPKSFFKDKLQKIFPGLIKEYDPSLYDPNALKPMEFEGGYDERINSYFGNLTSSTSGIYPNMQGQQTDTRRTATELNIQVVGQTTRLQYSIDNFSKYAIIPMIRNIADLNANNRVGEQIFMAFAGGKRTRKTINDDIRSGDYNYRYNDKSAITRKRAEFAELREVIKSFYEIPEMQQRFKNVELFNRAMELLGETNPNKYIKTDDELAQAQQPPPPQGGMPPEAMQGSQPMPEIPQAPLQAMQGVT